MRGRRRSRSIRPIFKSLTFTILVFFFTMVFPNVRGTKKGMEKKVLNMLSVGAILRWVFTTLVQFVIGWRFYIGAYKSLKHGSANMDYLVALGTNTAYIYSVYALAVSAASATFDTMDVFDISAMLITFILLGKYIEVLTKGKTSEAITKLMNLTPDTAVLLEFDADGNVAKEEEIDSRLIQKNDVVKILPGAKVVADGLVMCGAKGRGNKWIENKWIEIIE